MSAPSPENELSPSPENGPAPAPVTKELAPENEPVPSPENEPVTRKRAAVRGVKYVAVTAVFTALLLGAQYALWYVKGVELVTLLLLVFSYRFGVRCGVLSAVAFSLLRCFLFGFFPSVILLYLIYYPLFALLFGLLGRAFSRRIGWRIVLVLTAAAVVCTACFTFLDDVITPLFYGYTREAALAYFVASLPTMAVQTVCAALSVGLLARPLLSLLNRVKL